MGNGWGWGQSWAEVPTLRCFKNSEYETVSFKTVSLPTNLTMIKFGPRPACGLRYFQSSHHVSFPRGWGPYPWDSLSWHKWVPQAELMSKEDWMWGLKRHCHPTVPAQSFTVSWVFFWLFSLCLADCQPLAGIMSHTGYLPLASPESLFVHLKVCRPQLHWYVFKG